MAKANVNVTRGKWESTLRNVRAAKKRLTHLESRVRRIERALGLKRLV